MRADPAFLSAIRANRDDLALRLVYADWLEEQGDVRSELIRVRHEVGLAGDLSPRLFQLLEREHGLRAQTDEEWLARMGFTSNPQPGFDAILVRSLAGWRHPQTRATISPAIFAFFEDRLRSALERRLKQQHVRPLAMAFLGADWRSDYERRKVVLKLLRGNPERRDAMLRRCTSWAWAEACDSLYAENFAYYHCLECNRCYVPAEGLRRIWSIGPGRGFRGGREFLCPHDHLLHVVEDWTQLDDAP